MSLSGFFLVLCAAFCHATWNFFVKRINGGPELIWLFSLISVLIYLPFTLYIVFVDKPAFDYWFWLICLGSACLHLGYFLLLQTGYRRGDLSLVYPTARAIGPFLATSFAVIYLGEKMSLQVAIGAVAIIVSVLCLTGGFKKGAKNRLASIGFGICAGLFIGSYTVWDAYGVSVLLISPLIIDYCANFSRVIVLAPFALKAKHEVKRQWSEHRVGVFVIAIFSPLAYILVLYALTFTPVIYVAPTREISVLLSVLAGSLILGEGHLKQRLFWSCVILIGVALLATG